MTENGKQHEVLVQKLSRCDFDERNRKKENNLQSLKRKLRLYSGNLEYLLARNRVFRSSQTRHRVATNTRAGYMRQILVIFLGLFMESQKCPNVWHQRFLPVMK